jgi:hypothetical protein
MEVFQGKKREIHAKVREGHAGANIQAPTSRKAGFFATETQRTQRGTEIDATYCVMRDM